MPSKHTQEMYENEHDVRDRFPNSCLVPLVYNNKLQIPEYFKIPFASRLLRAMSNE